MSINFWSQESSDLLSTPTRSVDLKINFQLRLHQRHSNSYDFMKQQEEKNHKDEDKCQGSHKILEEKKKFHDFSLTFHDQVNYFHDHFRGQDS